MYRTANENYSHCNAIPLLRLLQYRTSGPLHCKSRVLGASRRFSFAVSLNGYKPLQFTACLLGHIQMVKGDILYKGIHTFFEFPGPTPPTLPILGSVSIGLDSKTHPSSSISEHLELACTAKANKKPIPLLAISARQIFVSASAPHHPPAPGVPRVGSSGAASHPEWDVSPLPSDDAVQAGMAA